MRRLWRVLTVVVTVLTSFNAVACTQFADRIVLDGKTEDLRTYPLQPFIATLGTLPQEFRPQHTACSRGYVATWTIQENRLFLVSMTDSGVGKDAKPLPLNLLKQEWKSPVKATWFTGTLCVPRGTGLGQTGESLYGKTFFVEVREGAVVRTWENEKPKGP